MNPAGGRNKQFEIRTLDQETQGLSPSMHGCCRGGRAARGREENPRYRIRSMDLQSKTRLKGGLKP